LVPVAGRVLYFAGLFFTLLAFTQLGRFAKLSFFLSWWAYSFPLAVITIASLLMYEQTSAVAYLFHPSYWFPSSG
jgi:tellurite resistance protein